MQRLRIASIFAALALAVAFGTATGAADSHPGEPFTEAKFRALQAQDALVLVDVSASWCSTCARQAQLVSEYRTAHPNVQLHVLRVDFDDQKDWVRYFGAPRQSTLLLYRGSERVWFAVAETRESILFEAFDEAAAG